jgi:hypothetical protein
MKRIGKVNVLLIACVLGLLGTLLVWVLPVSIKPYHLHRVLEDYQTNLVEFEAETGFGQSGLMHVYNTHQYGGGTPQAIQRFRMHWHQVVEHSPSRWPTDSSKLHYDEWGPSNWTRPDGIHVIEMGYVTCVPYSFLVIIISLPLLLAGAVTMVRRIRHRSPIPGRV